MADQTVGQQPASAFPKALKYAVQRPFAAAWQLRHGWIWAVIAAAVVSVGTYFYRFEGAWPNQLFVNCVTFMMRPAIASDWPASGRCRPCACHDRRRGAGVGCEECGHGQASTPTTSSSISALGRPCFSSGSTTVPPARDAVPGAGRIGRRTMLAYRYDSTPSPRRYAATWHSPCLCVPTPYTADIKGASGSQQYYWTTWSLIVLPSWSENG